MTTVIEVANCPPEQSQRASIQRREHLSRVDRPDAVDLRRGVSSWPSNCRTPRTVNAFREPGARWKEDVMDKELVIVVPTEAAAYEVVNALEGLDDDGSIELYSSTVLERAANGAVAIKDEEDARAGWGTALGVSTGALIGLLAGPAGAVVGAAIGGTGGLGGEVAYSGFAGDFVQEVAARLQPGTYAVVASVWEDWTVPVDVAVAPYAAGAVFRQSTDDVAAAQIRSAWQEVKEEEAHLDAEIARASGAAKAKLEGQRNALRAEQAAQKERLNRRAAKLQESWDAKIASIDAKAASAESEAKARHQRHTEKLSRFAATQKASFHALFA
jgi:uncharacterized membrane protein